MAAGECIVCWQPSEALRGLVCASCAEDLGAELESIQAAAALATRRQPATMQELAEALNQDAPPVADVPFSLTNEPVRRKAKQKELF